MNLGKNATIYMNFENSQWGSKVFKGELVGAGRDHILLKDNQTNTTYLLLRIYLSYITFDEEIEYQITGSTESDPFKGLISNESPVGKALLGKKKGDVVTVQTNSHEVEYKILEIKVK